MKIKGKRGKKIMLILTIIIGVIISLNIIGFIVNTVFFKDELKNIEPYGELVEVNGNNMHVYSMGNGEETIVLLPGLGVSLPSADFGPLMRELSKDYKVVTVEYFGIGFSDQVDTPRINENYMNEMRTALDQAGIKPPYILMPHSASGIYSEYYATKHPDEVTSIIMLDTTSTAELSDKKIPKFLYTISKLQQATGLTRLAFNLVKDTKLVENGYTNNEITDFKKFNYHVINDTFINQSLVLMDNIKEVNKLEFPSDIPVLKIISQESLDRMAKRDKDDGMGYQNPHIERIGNNITYEVIDGTHFIYQTETDKIVELTKQFLNEVNN